MHKNFILQSNAGIKSFVHCFPMQSPAKPSRVRLTLPALDLSPKIRRIMNTVRKSVCLLVIAGLRAQTLLAQDAEVLTRIRARILFHLQHQPNYTCTETIERSSRAKSTDKLAVVDTLRLEVALVDGREMFCWPGAKKFEEFDVIRLFPNGAVGTGDFSSHAHALFATSIAKFQFHGMEDFHGKTAIRFDYNVPQSLSRYLVRVASASAIVGYHGWFYADPQTLDVERIEVVADDLPPELRLSSVDDQIDYAMARIGEADFLLPSESRLTLAGLDGREDRNLTRFTSCRRFSGESVLTFGDMPPEKPGGQSESPPQPTREFELREGLEVKLVLTEQLDLNTAAVGDPVHARVDRDVKQKGEVIIPKGALALGRITRLEKHVDFSVLGLRFPQLDAPGIVAHMKGRLEDIVGIAPYKSHRALRVRTPPQPGEGLFPLNAAQRHLVKGCVLLWRT